MYAADGNARFPCRYGCDGSLMAECYNGLGHRHVYQLWQKATVVFSHEAATDASEEYVLYGLGNVFF